MGEVMTKPEHAWMVRAGNDNVLAGQVEVKSSVAIGWVEMGDLTGLTTRSQFKQRYEATHAEDSQSRIPVNAGQIYRFARVMKTGDYILTYIQATRIMLIGTITSEYIYDKAVFSKEYPYVRRVKWIEKVSRDAFSESARNSMGSVLTVFNLDNHIEEIHAIATGKKKQLDIEEVAEEAPSFYEDVKSKANELISDHISHLDGYQLQDLVAALFRAMGYHAISSPPGRDRGVDIMITHDPLGLEGLRIEAQVKHWKASVSSSDMRSFLGTLRNDHGVFVSTGGFTSEAQSEAAHAQTPVKLLDRDEFIELLLENYQSLEPAFQALVPLRKIWILNV